MATTSRDVTLTLAVETLGADGVKQLQTAFANLAKEGGNAGPEFKQLADQIARLGEQNDALNAFKQLTVATDELKASQAAAGFALDATATELIALNAAASQAGEQQRQAAQAVIEGKKAYIDLAAAIRDLKRDTDAAGKESDAYQQRLKSLGVAQDELKKKQIDLNAALRESNAEVRNAERDVAKLETKYNQQATALDRTADALRAQAGALKNASTEAAKLGVATDDIVAAETQLVGVMAQGTAALQSSADATRVLAVLQESVTKAKIEQAAATERLAAREREFSADRQRQAEQEQQAFAETARAAKLAADQIQNAFQTVGVRSAEELQAEIAQVRTAMQTLEASSLNTGKALNGAFASGEAKIKTLERELRELNGTMTAGDKAAKLFSNSMGQITAGNLIADGVGYLVNKVKEMGRAFLEAIVQGDQMRRGLTAVYGDAEIAAQQIDFLRKSSSESGVAFGALGQEFVKFSASMKLANIPMAQSNALFKSLTAASATLGLGTEATAGALNALGQMASKGTVSLEELRAQLGDRLPGALGLTAKSLGITEAQLIKLVESGGLATRDFIEPFTAALNTMKGEVDGIVPSWERFKGLMSETAQSAGDAGWTQVMNLGIKVLGGTVGVFTLGLSALSEGLFLVAKAAAAAALAFTSPREALALLTESLDQSRIRLTSQAVTLNNLIEPTVAVADATKAHAAAMSAATTETIKGINANNELSASQKLAALSAALAGDATLSASAKSVQFRVASDALLATQNALTDSLQKAAKAAKIEGDSLVELAKVSGDAVAMQQASVRAAELHAAALARVAASQSAETAILQAQKAALVATIDGRTITAETIKVQTDALDKLIIKSVAETEQAKQASAAAQQDLFSRKLAVELLKDHSKQLGEFEKKVAETAKTLQQYEVQFAQGKITEEEMILVRRAHAEALALQRDALGDVIRNTQLKAREDQAALLVESARVAAAGQHYEALAREARASGDVALATQYDISAKQEMIKVMRLQMELAKLQNAATLVELELKRKQITGTDDASEAKRREIAIEIELLKIKNIANEGIKDQIRAIEAEVQAIRNGTSARAGGTSGINADTSARYANAEAIRTQTAEMEKQAESERRAKKLEGQNAVDATLMFKIKEKLAQGTLTAADLADIKNVTESLDQNREINDFAQANGMMSAAGVVDDTTWAAVNARLKSKMQDLLQGGGGGGGFNGSGNGGGGGESAPTGGGGLGANAGSGGGGLGANAGSGGGGGFTPAPRPTNSGAGSNVTINLGAGVNMSNRADVEKLARTLIPAIEGLNRRGVSAG